MSETTPVVTGVRGGRTLDGRMADLLAGKKIVITGVTGFIGEQLLWKLLTSLPDTRAGVLVRRKGSATARARVIQLLKKRIFKDLREAAGGPEALIEQRIDVIEGDLPNVPDLPHDLDVLVHCAGDVSFDPPIDQAFATNVIGTRALMTKMLEAMTVDGKLAKIPHYVHVSTAYTAGRRRGAIPEAPHEHEADYMVETEAALAIAERIRTDSRTPERLGKLRREAERVHRQAGYLTTAKDIERRRVQWVHDELVRAGTERARSLGWTDVYTFAKAMGERIVADLGREIKVSIVRPAIVESSLVHPYPGWIEGFKMAEPIIHAYGKGQMPEFPASPDSVIDIVPCDHVVNCILAVCATEPEVGTPEFYHASSGARNPLTFRRVYHHIRNYFTEHPMATGARSTPLATWNWPGSAKVEQLLTTSERASKVANRLLDFAPRSRRTRSLAEQVDKLSSRTVFMRRYLSLYGEYLRSELHFMDDHTLALHRSLHPDDVATWAMDTAVIDWREYIEEIHTPSVTEPVRRMDRLRRRAGTRASTFRDLSKVKDDPSTVIAVFDLDGTVMSGNVVETYLWARLPELSNREKLSEVTALLGSLPAYLRAERTDRGTFLRAIYRRYAGADLAQLEAAIDGHVGRRILDRLSPDAIRRVREHRAAGHTTILMTGAIRPLTRPLAPLFDHIVAGELDVDADGRCTGFLTGPPMVGESRPAWLKRFAETHGIDLSKSYAYADSHADLPMLAAVGNPVAVNPDLGLMRAANSNSWTTVEWDAMAQTPRWSVQS
ncbi:HAD-IB family hydrolase [Granulicoccus phenolivorans]|uniref:HAD-IB family hydrolase n=1 Tax=Granulicoccus phenolivorans TaxID=266854 RepID=UPI0004158B8D|nr:HAD-IB family hydrolase [Granulicoccus phenolivorans]